MMTRRFVTVWCPDWPVAAAGLPSDEPAIVVRANRVVARSAAAAAEGVVAGQRRRQAQQCCPDATLVEHDPARDARAFEPLVQVIGRFTPRVEMVEPGWACLDARGPSRYFGGDNALAERLMEGIGAVTTAAVGVGVADGRFAAAIAAHRCGGGPPTRRSPMVVAPRGSPEFLAPLPVACLRELGEADAELVGLFARLGLATLGDVAALPAADVLARFGPPGRHAHRLAGGTDDRPPAGSEPPPQRAVERVFDDPVAELGPLVFTGKQLADELVAGLSAEGCVCTRLVIVAETEEAERTERVWYRAAGMSAPAMVERLRWQLDGWLRALANPGPRGVGSRIEKVAGSRRSEVDGPVRHAGEERACGGRIEKVAGSRRSEVDGPVRHAGEERACGGRIEDGVVLL
ncbi:MAG: DNA polymerase Y family protein, partial [Actinomycetota bacterium]|nr:DNA polymerase Y family protein [Actinomycetota bacterium]